MTNESNIEKKDFTIDKIGTGSISRSGSHTRKRRKLRFFKSHRMQKMEISILMTGVISLLIIIPLFTFLIDTIRKMLEQPY